MECRNYINPAVLSGFTGISDAELQDFLNLDIPDLDFDAYLNLDLAESDTNMTDSNGKLLCPGPSPAPSRVQGEKMNMVDPLLASNAWTEGSIVGPQFATSQQLTAPQALMSEYQTTYPWTQGHPLAPQPIPGVVYDSSGRVIPPSKGSKGLVSRWVPCSPPPQLLNTQVGSRSMLMGAGVCLPGQSGKQILAQVASQSTLINAGGYLPGHLGKKILPSAEGHFPTLAPQIGKPTLTQSVRDSDLNAANGFHGQVSKLPIASPLEADTEHPVPKLVATNHQLNSKCSTRSLTTKNPTKPRLRKPLLLTKPNPRYTPHPKYAPLPAPPASWSIYTYNPHGELTPSRLYAPTELATYLFTHPRPHTVILRIHRNAPDSRHRYPTNHSHRCRFVTCPMYPNNTINQGHIAVSIAEDGDERQKDPFLVAAWVHLWCLERFTDFVRVCRELNVEADTRDLPWEKRERNPFQLATAAEEKCVSGFIRACQSGRGVPPGYPSFDMPNRPHEGTLTHRLACVKLKREPSGVGKQRELREQTAGYRGSSLDVHVGDLEVERRVRGWTRRHANQNQVVVSPMVPRVYRGVRFVRGGEEEEEEDADGEVEDEDGEEEEELGWVKAAREPVFECRPQKGVRGKKRGNDEAGGDRIADEKVELSVEDDGSADEEEEDEEEDEDDALEEQVQEPELQKKQMTRSGKRANTEAESDEEEDDDDVVVPSRKRLRK